MRKIMSDPEIVMSPLFQEIIEDDAKIQVDIYRGENEAYYRKIWLYYYKFTWMQLAALIDQSFLKWVLVRL